VNTLKLSLLTITFLLTVGCNDNSNNNNEEPTTKVTNVAEAKKSYQSLSALKSVSGFSSQVSTTSQTSTQIQKTTSGACEKGGTVTLNEEANGMTIVANQCKYDNSYMNGTMSMSELSDGSEKMTMTNFSMKDGEIEMTVSNMVFVENTNEYWSTMDGDINIVSKCFSGNYNFKTIQKMYDAQDGTDNVESGIMELNGARYTFDNPYVTIKAGDEEQTISQSELEKQMNNTTTCSE